MILTFSAPTPYDCNFENNLCTWSQDIMDKFDWTRSQGPTGSYQTGPVVDHTLGNSEQIFISIIKYLKINKITLCLGKMYDHILKISIIICQKYFVKHLM